MDLLKIGDLNTLEYTQLKIKDLQTTPTSE